jgi:signal transduction histidine kinase
LLAPVRLDVLVRDAGQRWSAASRREITVVDSEPVCVLGDEQRLRHSLDALVENALNATDPNDRVTVRSAVRDGWAQLAVKDTGCGIAPADVDRMFERFVRGPCAGDRPGTGLGLPIVKAIAEAHGGTVTVTSRPAHGSTFRLRIGLARAPCPGTTPSDRRELAAQSRSSWTMSRRAASVSEPDSDG